MADFSSQRLRVELREAKVLFGRWFFPFVVDGVPQDRCSSYGVEGRYKGYRVVITFHPHHPYSAPRVILRPKPKSSHYYEDSLGEHLCYCKAHEWSSSYTISTTIAIVIRFIDRYKKRKVD